MTQYKVVLSVYALQVIIEFKNIVAILGRYKINLVEKFLTDEMGNFSSIISSTYYHPC